MRGSLSMFLLWIVISGIIPAHAGLTGHTSTMRRRIRDHPRACGAHCSASFVGSIIMGSSPRMRGSLVANRDRYICLGIIPAHAGLTSWFSGHSSRSRDHPRACGAHTERKETAMEVAGSSPRMRGSHALQLQDGLVCGIIPAHAGLTSAAHSLRPAYRDHPRACGAHPMLSLCHFFKSGSSPRMRGSPGGLQEVRRRPGIIPAHAGLTSRPMNFPETRGDHPHACGAHTLQNRTRTA